MEGNLGTLLVGVCLLVYGGLHVLSRVLKKPANSNNEADGMLTFIFLCLFMLGMWLIAVTFDPIPRGCHGHDVGSADVTGGSTYAR